ncbi:hypothetical protein LX32DRAFT_321421 [Colletotrichum zoysiae]|uniref:Uncharacterized protein n=1 Tax=Colletotrichum zoysiae TaxID=1216348 RepID=A0AAD9HM87_9PEZI|nr:hypothetical protein LX32DRAFT_321421 [Colletotrichum zoysiae]
MLDWESCTCHLNPPSAFICTVRNTMLTLYAHRRRFTVCQRQPPPLSWTRGVASSSIARSRCDTSKHVLATREQPRSHLISHSSTAWFRNEAPKINTRRCRPNTSLTQPASRCRLRPAQGLCHTHRLSILELLRPFGHSMWRSPHAEAPNPLREPRLDSARDETRGTS